MIPVQSHSGTPAGNKARPAGIFATTHWTMVLQAGDPDAPEGFASLSRLCENYWYPVYAYLRRDGQGEEAARDLTQGFFAEIIGERALLRADRERGHFRGFLVGALRRYLAGVHAHDTALKRGGGRVPVSLDAGNAEARYHCEPRDCNDPERLYERSWALELIGRATRRLEEEFRAAGREKEFAEISVCALGAGSVDSYTTIASRLGVTENRFKQWVFRARQRHATLLREVIMETVSAPEELEDEIRHLLAVLE